MTTTATTATVADDDLKTGSAADNSANTQVFTSESHPNYIKLHKRSKSILEQSFSLITDKELIVLLANEQKQQSKELLIIDVRDSSLEDGDFQGGHIYGAVNIPNYDFVDELPNVFHKKYKAADMKHVVFHCMYSRSRARQCYRFYEKARALLIIKGKKSNDDGKDNTTEDGSSAVAAMKNDSVFEDIVFGGVAKHLSDAQFANIAKQKVYVLQGGFQYWLNYHKDNKNLTADFDEKMWDLARMSGAEDAGMMLYHKYDG